MYSQKRKAVPIHEDTRRLERDIRAQMAGAAGGTLYGNDPVASVTDQFRKNFDALGRSIARRRAGEAGAAPESAAGEEQTERPTGVRESARSDAPEGEQAERHAAKPGGSPIGKRLRGFPTSPIPLQKFSDVAFRRGNLAGSILQGTGKMMLVSCLRRTVNPRRPEPHEAFQLGVTQKPLSGHDPDSMVFMRDLARGAVSIVVDTLHDARRTVEMLEEAVARGGKGASHLFALYPFLDDSRERAMLEQYRASLADSADVNERALLQHSLVHTEAMIENKARMRMDFLAALRQLSERAAWAAEEFEEPDFAESVARAALEPEEPEDVPPPDEPNGNGGRRAQEENDGTQQGRESEQPDADPGAAGEPADTLL